MPRIGLFVFRSQITYKVGRMFHKPFLCSWLCLSLFSAQATADNLLDIYQLALQNDPTFRAAQASLRAGLEEENLGLAGLLPQVNVDAGFGLNRTESRGQFPAGGTLFPSNTDVGTETKTWGVSLEQPIFDLSAWFRFRRGQELTEQAKAQFSADQQDLIIRVAEAYVEVLRALANLRASRAQEDATQRQLEQARERFEVGLVAITDVRDAEAAHDLSVANRLADEGALRVAQEQLSILTGRQHKDFWVLQEDYPVVDPDPLDRDQWVKFARQHNYDIKVAVLSQDAAMQAARAAGAEHLPKITANMSYSENRSENDYNNLSPRPGEQRYTNFPRNTNQGALSLNVTMPLFAGGGISASRRQAYAEYERAQEDYLGALRNTVQGTRAEYINVVTDVARVQARNQAIISNRSSLEATEAGYQAGTRTLVDVLIAVRTLYSAIRDYANSRLDYVLAKLRLKRNAGTLSPADIRELNRWLEKPSPEEAQETSTEELPEYDPYQAVE